MLLLIKYTLLYGIVLMLVALGGQAAGESLRECCLCDDPWIRPKV